MSEENLDIRKVFASYMGIVFRAIGYWKWGVALCLVVTMGGTVYAATRRKIWSSSTRIRVISAQVRDTGEMLGEEDVGEQLRKSLNNFIGSRFFLQKIVDEYDLYRDIKLNKNMTDEEVLAHMREKINHGVWGGEEFGFRFYDHDPRTAQAVTKSLTKSFIEREKGEDYSLYLTKLKRVEKQLTELEEQLDKKREEQTQFKMANKELLQRLRERQLGALTPMETAVTSDETRARRFDSPQLRRLRSRLKTLEETEARLRSRSSGAKVTDTALAARRQEAAEVVQQAKRRYDTLRQQYTEEWPDVRVALNQLKQAQMQQREVEQAFRDSNRATKEPVAEIKNIQVQISQTRDEVRRMERRELIELQRSGKSQAEEEEPDTKVAQPLTADQLKSVEEVEAELKRMDVEIAPLNDQVQELHIQRLKLEFQAKQREHGGFQYRVIDEANLPTKPDGPHRTKIAAVSGGIGFILGCFLMLILGFVDSRVYRPSDLNRLENVPLLVTVPDFENELKEIAQASAPHPDDYEEQPDG